MRCGLVEGAKNERGVAWRVVSDSLGVTEVGSGTTMTKVLNSLYIGVQGGTLKKVDLSTGQISDLTQVNSAISQFNASHGYELEAAVPPSVFAYGDTVIVDWDPLAVKTVQTATGPRIDPVNVSLHLGLQNDQILAEIHSITGTVTTYKQGHITGRTTYGEGLSRGLLFPGK
jgi:hypothetical protein